MVRQKIQRQVRKVVAGPWTVRLRYVWQAIAYGAFMGLIGYFSNSPAYQHLPADQATIKLSLRHSGKLLGECTQRTPEEMLKLPPNMRVQAVCPRERSALVLELDLNGEMVFSQSLEPRGLHGDGMASAYHRLSVPAGDITVRVRLKDHVEQQEFPYQAEYDVTLDPAQVLVIDFDSQKKQFTFL